MRFILPSSEELTAEKLQNFINKHKAEILSRYLKLDNAYKNDYPILHEKAKEPWKPDNRAVVNMAKYIVDTINGFFMGIPVKTICDDEKVAKYVENLEQYNNQDDNDAELSKLTSIFGKAYEMYYVDEFKKINIIYLSPLQAFVIYDDKIIPQPRFFVRLYTAPNGEINGSISDNKTVRYFNASEELTFYGEEILHGFSYVPVSVFCENEEETGAFEPVLSLINGLNKALSEKMNDVDSFADAYLKVLGAELDKNGQNALRSNRIINFGGADADKMVVEFMQKPEADNTQEHLISHLERYIYQISMVANISNESFGTSSGIAIKYKLLAMSNLAKIKERKFAKGMNNRYKIIFSNPLSEMGREDWVKIYYKFTQNFPANLLEETQIASNLAGITSKETQLKALSIVDNVNNEIDKIDKENDLTAFMAEYPTNRAGVEND